MVVKFECPKCGKRFVDWGAEKLGFKCPTCADSEEMVQMGGASRKGSSKAAKNAAAKRAIAKSLKKRVAVAAASDTEAGVEIVTNSIC